MLIRSIAVSVLVACSSASAKVVTVKPGGAHPTIQSGIDAAAAGDTIKIHAGVYREAVVVPAGKDGLELRGLGNVTVEPLDDQAAVLGSGIKISANGVRLNGLAIRDCRSGGIDTGWGILAPMSVAHVAIVDCSVLGCGAGGIFVAGDDTLVKSVTVSGAPDAIQLVGDRARIDRVVVRNADGAAIRVEGDAAQVRNASVSRAGSNSVLVYGDDLRVQNCRLDGCFGTGIEVTGDRAALSRNRVTSCEYGGIFVSGEAPVLTNNSVTACSQEHCRGIVVDASAPGGRVAGNTVRAVNGIGLEVGPTSLQLELTKNTIEECGEFDQPGVLLAGDGHSLRKNLVRNCREDGIRIKSGHTALDGDRAEGNVVDGFVIWAAAIVLDGCRATGNGAEGVENKAVLSIVRDCVMKDNRIDLAGAGLLDTTHSTGNVFTTGGPDTLPQLD